MSWSRPCKTALDEAKAGKDSPGEGADPTPMTTPSERPTRPNPLRDPQDRRLPRIAGPCVLVIFGVTGDLSTKKLMPAVYDLANRGLLPPGFALVGFARREWEHQDFARIVHDAVQQHARTPFREEVWKQLSEGIRFVPGEIGDDESVRRLAGTPSPSWTRRAAPAATTPSTCPSRRACSRPWSTSCASTDWPSSTPGSGAGW